jgi:SAM-dependent methyltransferase
MKVLDQLLQKWRISKAQPYVTPGARVLDIGCANGELFRSIPEMGEGVGVDPDLPASAAPVPRATLVKGLFPQALPDHRPFDVISLLAVLEHVPPEAQKTLAVECARHLKPGGYLIITVPSPNADYVLAALRFLRLIHGMALDQHYGYDPSQTGDLFSVGDLVLVEASKFQFGLNNLFVFRKTAPACDAVATPAQPRHEAGARELVVAAC